MQRQRPAIAYNRIDSNGSSPGAKPRLHRRQRRTTPRTHRASVSQSAAPPKQPHNPVIHSRTINAVTLRRIPIKPYEEPPSRETAANEPKASRVAAEQPNEPGSSPIRHSRRKQKPTLRKKLQRHCSVNKNL